MPNVVVETNLGSGNAGDVWRHQVRWSRTIRVSRPGGYLGYVVTHATFWCVVAALAGAWQIAIVGLVVRLAAAASALFALGADMSSLPFVPFRDLVGFGRQPGSSAPLSMRLINQGNWASPGGAIEVFDGDPELAATHSLGRIAFGPIDSGGFAEISGTLDIAVANAARDAEAAGLTDAVVLLSPACASFDQYRNFEIRGTKFRDLVQALPGVMPVV